jgi:hypothetical protein
MPLARALPRLFAIALLIAPTMLSAQGNRRTNVTTTGFTLTSGGASTTDYDAGSVTIGTTGFTVNLTTNNGGGGFSPRVTTVQVRCNTPCPASGTLALAGLQWRRTDLGVWNTLTTTFVTIETRTATFNGTNDPWSNSVVWRYALTWGGVPPTAATAFNVQFQLVVAAP